MNHNRFDYEDFKWAEKQKFFLVSRGGHFVPCYIPFVP